MLLSEIVLRYFAWRSLQSYSLHGYKQLFQNILRKYFATTIRTNKLAYLQVDLPNIPIDIIYQLEKLTALRNKCTLYSAESCYNVNQGINVAQMPRPLIDWEVAKYLRYDAHIDTHVVLFNKRLKLIIKASLNTSGRFIDSFFVWWVDELDTDILNHAFNYYFGIPVVDFSKFIIHTVFAVGCDNAFGMPNIVLELSLWGKYYQEREKAFCQKTINECLDQINYCPEKQEIYLEQELRERIPLYSVSSLHLNYENIRSTVNGEGLYLMWKFCKADISSWTMPVESGIVYDFNADASDDDCSPSFWTSDSD